MKKMSHDFANKVTQAMKNREAKALAVADGISDFINWAIKSHNADSITSDLDFYNCSAEGDVDIRTPKFHSIYFFSKERSCLRVTLGIIIEPSGKVALEFNGAGFEDEDEFEEFDMDDSSAEDTVAKIINIIQNKDILDFGPLLTQAAQCLWEQVLALEPEKTPDYVAPAPETPQP